MLFSPFGYALRAGRDSPLRAEAIGIDVRAYQWAAFVLAGAMAGLAGALFAFSKGSISPVVDLDPAIDRRAGDGAAGRRRDADRAGGRRRGLHLAARRAGARDRILARRARPDDPADRRRLPAGPGRRPQGARTRAGERRA